MNTINSNNISIYKKDKPKGQKILAAIYMVTNHLSENDPLVREIRSTAVEFVCRNQNLSKELLTNIETLLGSATLAGLISEKNSSIIFYEAKHYYENSADRNHDDDLGNLFTSTGQNAISKGHSIKDTKRTENTNLKDMSHRESRSMSVKKNPLDLITRQDKILAFVNDRKSAVIKDITSLFPEVSEKTIQRELNRLIDEGKINKRGSKRWSIYMAVNSLL